MLSMLPIFPMGLGYYPFSFKEINRRRVPPISFLEPIHPFPPLRIIYHFKPLTSKVRFPVINNLELGLFIDLEA